MALAGSPTVARGHGLGRRGSTPVQVRGILIQYMLWLRPVPFTDSMWSSRAFLTPAMQRHSPRRAKRLEYRAAFLEACLDAGPGPTPPDGQGQLRSQRSTMDIGNPPPCSEGLMLSSCQPSADARNVAVCRNE